MLLKARLAPIDDWIRNRADIRSHAYEDAWIGVVNFKKFKSKVLIVLN